MKKRLLNETTVRKMMKLANIQPLTESFLEETEGLEETQDVTEEEVTEEGAGVYDRDDDMGAPDMDTGEEELPMDTEPVDDVAPEGDAGDDGVNDGASGESSSRKPAKWVGCKIRSLAVAIPVVEATRPLVGD